MSDIAELAQDFARRSNQPATCGDLARLVGALRQVGEAVKEDRKFVDALQARMMIVDDLPADAPYGALIRRRTGTVGERATLYLGNGAGQPITKLPTPTSV